MKKLLSCVAFSAVAAMSLSADYMLVLTDKDGNQNQECIKSYSFSNNLESLARKNSVGLKDVYSEEETMTNKVYMGKPVYRMITTIPTLTTSLTWKVVNYEKIPENMDTFISARQIGNEHLGATNIKNAANSMFYVFYSTTFGYILGSNRIGIFSGKKVILEYTKTTDTADSSSNSFKSYIHYVPSSSEDEEVITKDMKNLGVQFLEGYTYDTSTTSCIKN